MRQMIKIEFQKLFENIRFYFSVTGISVGLLLSALDLMRFDKHSSVDNIFHMAATTAFLIICFVLCIVGGGFSFCVEQKNRCIRYEILRCNVRAYSGAKVITAFAGGYLSSFMGCLLGEIGMGLALMFRYKNWSQVVTGYEGIQLNLVYILQFSLLCGVLSVLALLVTIFIPDYFVAMCAPVLLYFAWLNISGWLSLPACLDITNIFYVHYNSFDIKQFFGDFTYALLITACLLYFMWLVINKGIKWRSENG